VYRLLALLLLLPAIARAELPPSLQSAAETLSSRTSVQASFTQTKNSILFMEPEVRAGRLELRRADGRLLWLYDGEAPKILLADGRAFPAFKSAKEAGVEGAEGYSMPGLTDLAKLMAGLVALEPTVLDARFVAVEAGDNRWTLTPKKAGDTAMFKTITIAVGGSPLAVTSVEMAEATGDTTVLAFEDTVLDAALDPVRFQTPRERSTP